MNVCSGSSVFLSQRRYGNNIAVNKARVYTPIRQTENIQPTIHTR